LGGTSASTTGKSLPVASGKVLAGDAAVGPCASISMRSISVGTARSLHTTTTIFVFLSWLEQAARPASTLNIKEMRRMAI
jgi:hypothetical protein